MSKNLSLPNPPGFAPLSAQPITAKGKGKKAVGAGDTAESQKAMVQASVNRSNELKMKKAWEVALSPAKSLPMQAFMLYMSGSGIQLFSMGIVWALLTTPWQAAWNVLTTFEPFKQSSPDAQQSQDPSAPKASIGPLILPIITFIGCQVLVLALGVWKCKQMGLVPIGTGDWLQFETRGEPPEWSAVRLAAYGQ
ncbi:hypothetical protein NliqN6_3363 [Naganishia liquefaciens]|uniref:ER membrane protein complex subunit 4 n=1 Tax=Naganishia liquefaciens TaxID=104408 RepID=A0A8H3TU33_9TREE|nr:hypothetical protein NliqN6_3363 [Naganishia liquefaciens]